ncbi:protein regulator of cytokinesis 1-like [Neodiprion virginianus]|uniref:protein regulator of cytokinesis 1-like n=1 Tax=Neodiprion virginianus TaxID=2961670 RepID=UPI001EE72C6C|nr:protein regulator of cytokinesis 1-like [Neodiprion virginianus]
MEQDLESSSLGQMEDQSITLAKQVEGLKIEAVSLQNHLEKPIENYQEILERIRKCITVTKETLEDEIERCKQDIREKTLKYITKLRSRIEDLWRDCYYGEEECFRPFQEQTFTEDLFNLHEMEMERLCEHYNFCRPFVALVNKRQDLAKQMYMMEHRTKVTNLYQNQGDRRLAHNSRHSDTRKLKAETKKSIQQRGENIERVVRKLRFRIQELWHQCFVGDDKRKAFQLYEVYPTTEHLHSSYEKGFKKQCKYYGCDRQPSVIWIQIPDLEDSQASTGEETIRNLQKELLELETQYKVLVEQYEKKHGVPYKTGGRMLADSVQLSGTEYMAVERPGITLK